MPTASHEAMQITPGTPLVISISTSKEKSTDVFLILQELPRSALNNSPRGVRLAIYFIINIQRPLGFRVNTRGLIDLPLAQALSMEDPHPRINIGSSLLPILTLCCALKGVYARTE